jgi:predicted NBD/HSP70 family sugar kinase
MRGADGTGMEFGPVPVAGQGITCSCGQVGCLETFVNLAALARAYPVAELSSSDRGALPGLVAAAAERGDPAAQAAVADLSRHLATGIATLVNIFNPSQVLLGGVMRPVLDQLLPDLRTRVAHRIIPGTRLPDIGVSGLDRFECAIGAACLAHHRAFDLQNLDLTAPDPA